MLSIIVPVYNAEQYLRECIDSIYKNINFIFELILINDGSKDGSLAICREYEEKNTNVKVIDQQNCGVSAARNAGIKIASYEYLTFVDADDIFDGFSQEYLPLPDDVQLSAFSKFFTSEERIVVADNIEQINLSILLVNGSRYEKCSFCSACAKIFRKSFILENNLFFNSSLMSGEDKIFVLNYISRCENILLHPLSIYKYRMNASSTTHSFQPKIIDTEHQFLTRIKSEVSEFVYSSLAIDALWWCLVMNICHIENKIKHRERVKRFKDLISSDLYRESYKNYKLYIGSMSSKRKFIFMLLSKKMYRISFFVLRLLSNRIRSIKEYILEM